MTTKTESWPEKVYLTQFTEPDDFDDRIHIYVWMDDKNGGVEYVKADIAAAREQEKFDDGYKQGKFEWSKVRDARELSIIRATLEAAKKRILDYDFAAGAKNFALMLDDIDPATILNNMKVEK